MEFSNLKFFIFYTIVFWNFQISIFEILCYRNVEFSNLKFLKIFGNNEFNLTNHFKKLKYFFSKHINLQLNHIQTYKLTS